MTLHPYEGPRGLRGYTRLEDTDGAQVEVQESSAVLVGEEETGPFCWLRIQTRSYLEVWQHVVGGSSVTAPGHASAHLTPAMAQELVDALTDWLGDVDESASNREKEE